MLASINLISAFRRWALPGMIASAHWLHFRSPFNVDVSPHCPGAHTTTPGLSGTARPWLAGKSSCRVGAQDQVSLPAWWHDTKSHISFRSKQNLSVYQPLLVKNDPSLPALFLSIFCLPTIDLPDRFLENLGNWIWRKDWEWEVVVEKLILWFLYGHVAFQNL